jgi:allantoinase
LKKLESGDFLAAWGGISGLQLGLPITWTGASRRGFGLPQLSHWMSEAPAKLAGLSERKGRIAVGLDADFTVFEPEAQFTVDAPALFHKNKVTPYAGETLTGVVRSTWLRGERVFHDGAPSPTLKGHLL